MNLDLLYIISFVLLKGNTLSNTDILNQADTEVTLAFHRPELRLCATDCTGHPEKHAQNPRLTPQGSHTKTGWELERILTENLKII